MTTLFDTEVPKFDYSVNTFSLKRPIEGMERYEWCIEMFEKEFDVELDGERSYEYVSPDGIWTREVINGKTTYSFKYEKDYLFFLLTWA